VLTCWWVVQAGKAPWLEGVQKRAAVSEQLREDTVRETAEDIFPWRATA
jgi:hypothetical protein